MATKEEIVRFLSLSKREKEALGLFCEGLTYKEIAKKMVIEPGAVSAYMSRSYKKLGLFGLSQVERVRQLVEIYSPLFEAEIEAPDDEPEEVFDAESNELVLVDDIIEIPSPEEEKILQADEKAIVIFHQEPLTTKQKKRKKDKSRGGGCRRLIRRLFTFIFVLVVLATLGGGGWYLWQNGDLDDLPCEIFGFTLPLPQCSSEVSPTPRPTQKPTTSSGGTTTNPTPRPTNTPRPLVTGPLYEVGEWHKEGDLWIRVFEYRIESDRIRFVLEIWNKTGSEILFSWNPYSNTFLIDNNGQRYGAEWETTNLNEQIAAGEKTLVVMNTNSMFTSSFIAEDFLYAANVTDVYYTIEYFSRIDRATWHVEIGK
jgi:DNA-binding CsgD family transcriptional regulator